MLRKRLSHGVRLSCGRYQMAGTGRKRKRIGLPLKTTIAEGRCYL